MKHNQKILVSGAGIAGLTSAFWLDHYGFNVTVIERAAEIRDEGYMVDFYGEGVQMAKAMGILDKLYNLSSGIKNVNIVNDIGDKIGSLKISDIQQAMENSNSGYMPLMRGHLERTIYETLPEKVKFRFNTSIQAIKNQPDGTRITFSNGEVENFDLVIGAEGIHSSTRALVFGPEEKFKVSMDTHVAIVRLKGAGHNKNGIAKTNMNIGNFATAFPTNNNDLIAVFAYTSNLPAPHEHNDALALLKQTYNKKNQFSHQIINQITDDTYIYMDEVAQIRMPKWCDERVALVGDAAACLTLLSGQGSLMAMTASYILARELSLANGDHKVAFKAYEDILMPVISKKAIVSSKVSLLIPKNWLSYKIFLIMFRFMKFPFVQKMVFKQYMKPTVFDLGYPLETISKNT